MTATTEWQELFKPGSIGEMTLKNRIVMPPLGTNFALEDGQVSERLLDYYEARAKGGLGLVIVEVTCIDTPVDHSPIFLLLSL